MRKRAKEDEEGGDVDVDDTGEDYLYNRCLMSRQKRH